MKKHIVAIALVSVPVYVCGFVVTAKNTNVFKTAAADATTATIDVNGKKNKLSETSGELNQSNSSSGGYGYISADYSTLQPGYEINTSSSLLKGKCIDSNVPFVIDLYVHGATSAGFIVGTCTTRIITTLSNGETESYSKGPYTSVEWNLNHSSDVVKISYYFYLPSDTVTSISLVDCTYSISKCQNLVNA